MNRAVWRAITYTWLAIMVSSCGNPELSRPEAEEKILASQPLTERRLSIPIVEDALREGVLQGLWRIDGRTIVLKQKIASEISTINEKTIVLHNPADIAVTVTGIAPVAGSESLNEVQFDWKYAKLPPLVKRFALYGGDGRSMFRLYDDGWRLESTKLNVTYQPMDLTAAEQEAMGADYDAEFERVRQIEEARRKQKEERDQKIASSMTPTHEIGTYRYSSYISSDWKPRIVEGIITLTDVGFSLSNEQPGRKTKILNYNFYDGYMPNQDKKVAKYGFRAGREYKIKLTSGVYKSTTWGWRTNALIVEPFFTQFHSTKLWFQDAEERDRFAADLAKAVDEWLSKYSELVRTDGRHWK